MNAGRDYPLYIVETAPVRNLTFSSGDTAGSVRSLEITVYDDIIAEETEFFFLVGSVSAPFAQFSNGIDSDGAVINIIDDDCKCRKEQGG